MPKQEASFFVVWCPTRGAPTVRHDRYDPAIEEAKRLARSTPGEDFFVLQAMKRIVRREPIEVIDLDDDDIPL